MTSSPLDRYVDAILRYPWRVVAGSVLLMLAAAAGTGFITVTNDHLVLFRDDNPQRLAFQALENTYSASDRALIAVAPREGSVFTRQALGALVELTEAAWGAPYSSRVDSLTNYSHSEALGEDDLVVAPLVEDASSLSNLDLTRIETIAMGSVDLVGRLVADDGRTAGMAINFVLPENHDLAVREIGDFLDSLLEHARASHPRIDYYVTGDVPLNRAFSRTTVSDLRTLTPIVFLVIVGLTVFLLRSMPGAAAVVAVLLFRRRHGHRDRWLARRGVQPHQLRRAAHRHGDSGRRFHPRGHLRPVGLEPRAGQTGSDHRVVSRQRIPHPSHLDNHRGRLPQPERR